MRLQLLVTKGHRQKGARLENDIAGLHDPAFQHGQCHHRTKSNGTSLTHDLTVNTEESHSAEEKIDLNYGGDIYEESHELLSPLHMIQYGKSLSEPSFNYDTTLSENPRSEDSDSVYLCDEGLSCIIEESSRETESHRSTGMLPSPPEGKHSNPTLPSLIHGDQTSRNFSRSYPLDYIIHKTLDNQPSRVGSPSKSSSQINAVSPRLIKMDGSILAPIEGLWSAFGSDPFSRRDLILNRFKRSAEHPLGSKHSYKSLDDASPEPSDLECKNRRHQTPIIGNKSCSKMPAPSSRKEIRSGVNYVFVDGMDQEEICSSWSSDGSSDRQELLKRRNNKSQRKTHRRSSRSWRDFFSRAMTSPDLLPKEENEPVSVYDLAVSGLDGEQNLMNSQQEDEIECWTLADGTVRMEI